MPTIEQDLQQIRKAVYGREVREAIADGIEHCYDDVTNGVTLAEAAVTDVNDAIAAAETQTAAAIANVNTAITRANTAAEQSEEINEELGYNANSLVLVQANQPTEIFNKLWVKPESDEYEVPTYAEHQAVAADVDALKSALSTDEAAIKDLQMVESVTITMNRYRLISITNKTISTNAGGGFYVSSPITVAEGELYRITCEGYGNAAAFAYGNNGEILETYPDTVISVSTSTYAKDKLILIPHGVTELYIANTTQGDVTTPNVVKVVVADTVLYTSQTKTDSEKAVARSNIGAVGIDDFTDVASQRFVDYSISTVTNKLINDYGVVTDYSGHSDYTISNNLDVSNTDIIIVSCAANYSNTACAFYDENDNVVSRPLRSSTGSSSIERFSKVALNVPSTASYCIIANISNVPTAAYHDGYTTKKLYQGLKWAAVGDSLTEENSRTTKHYHDYISEETGITVVNMGVSGTGYKRKEGDNKAFYQRVANIPTDADVVTIFGSGNDQTYYGDAMGTATDTGTDTLGGCINTTIDNIYAVLPTVQLGIIAPCPWQGYNPVNHSNGMALYTELLRQICENRSIPFLDLYHSSNLRPWDATFRSLAYSKDDGNGTHPDETGHKLLAGRIRVFLDSLIGAY